MTYKSPALKSDTTQTWKFDRGYYLQQRLEAQKIKHRWYWGLRNAGFENIEAEQFIIERTHWIK